jgi:hypothetical protein
MRSSVAVSIASFFLVLNLAAASSPAFALTATTTTVVCSSPVTLGFASNCVITVTPTAATGTVNSFMSTGSRTFGAASCVLSSGSCSVSYTPTNASGSPHVINATYVGFGTSAGAGDGSVTVSSVAVGCAPSTVIVGSSSTCQATVTGYPPGGATGTVTFIPIGGGSGKTSLIAAPAMCTLVGASCQVAVSTKGAGGASINASYSGDANNTPSHIPKLITLSIIPTTTSTTVVCAPAVLTVGQQATCTATVKGYSPTGVITWQTTDNAGIFSANPCTLASGSCGVSYTATSSALITASYAGDANNTASHGTFSITANVNEMIQITVANSGPAATVALSGCSVSPTSITANGIPQPFQASSGCSGIVATLPPAGANTRYLNATGGESLNIASCAASSCQSFSATIYFQLLNTYQVAPASPSSWSSAGSIIVSGTVLGTAGQQLCKITVSTGGGQFSCQGWSDFDTQTTLGILQVSQNQRWASGHGSFTDISGGNHDNSSYFSQVLENFQYSLVGSTTAPTAHLLYTGFGTTSTFPLTGSESLVWLDSGSSWSVPAALSGSSSSERWEGLVTSGAATAGQTVALMYYHQFMVIFGYSVAAGGSAYAPPSIQFTSFGARMEGTQGWVDAGTSYSFTNPLDGSTASERWLTPTQDGVASSAGTVSPVYYHQYAFALNFTVSGGGIYDNPRLNFTSLGNPGLEQLNATRATIWMDAGTKWGVSVVLPNSSPAERWVTKQTASGNALAPFVGELLYYHQDLGTMRYSIQGTGGSPPVPSTNYTSLGGTIRAQLNETAQTFWIDTESSWSASPILPGVQGERWQSNVPGPIVVGAPFQQDVQYTHQFYMKVGVSTAAGGQVANADQWKDQGDSVILNATSAHSWSFAYWQGATIFSYNGTTRLPTLTVSGPVNETAIFFPGLHISADKQGSVAYSYGTISGTVPAGTNTTIYPPPGRNVTLIAMPNTVETKFDGWTGEVVGPQLPSALANNLQAWVSIDLPSVVHATFATDYTDIRTFAVAAIGIFIAAAFVFVIRRGYTPMLKQ